MSTQQSQIKRITLYKNALSFTERKGLNNVTLPVRKKNKELIVSTLSAKTNNNTPVTIRFDAPMEEPVPQINFNYGANKDIGEFLTSLIGSNVAVTMSDAVKEGIVLLVSKDKTIIKGSDNQIEDKYSSVTLMATTGEIENVSLANVSSVRILDQYLQAQLIQSITRNNQKKRGLTVKPKDVNATTITFSTSNNEDEEKESEIDISYLTRHTTPWKANYRLFIDSESKDQVRLKMLGSIQNETKEDWNDIQLALVANVCEVLQKVNPSTSAATRNKVRKKIANVEM